MPPLKVIIIGGGLAGACLANGQVDVRVFERDGDGPDKGGYQIRLGAHALIGFKACLTEKQYADLLLCFGKSGGIVSSAPCIFSPSDLKVLIDLSKAPIYEKSAPITRLRLRNFLQAPLRELNMIEYGKRFVRYEVPENINIRVHFQDDSHQDCDVLVSAEGSGSCMNKHIGLDNILKKVRPGHGGLLGKCHLPWHVLQSLPRQLLEKGTIYTGNSKAMVLPRFTCRKGLSSSKQTTYTEDMDDDDLKPKNYDEEEASLFLGMFWTTVPSSSEIPDIKGKKALMRQKLAEAGFHPDFSSLVDAVDNEALMTTPWRYAKSDTPINWRQLLLAKDEKKSNPDIANPRVWLIGDSIHPMLPSRGMGANNAIHDTADALQPLLALAKLKSSHGVVRDDQVSTPLAVYEKAMIPRAFGWVKKSTDQQVRSAQSHTKTTRQTVAGNILVTGS